MLRCLLIAGSTLLLALPLAAQQDNPTPPPQNPPAQTNPPAPQKKDQPKKNTAQENPFPEAQSEAAAKQAQQGSGSEPSAPEPSAPEPSAPEPKSGSQPSKPTGSDQNPFPEEQAERAAHQSPQGGAANPNDHDYSSSRVKGLDMPTTDEAPPPDLPPSSLPYNPKLARKDAQVGDYYMDSGNWQGAYERFLEANRSDPGNAEAVFGLAESARHLHRPGEALRNYRLYLAALPNGPRAKDARKALKEMGAEPAS